MNDYRQAKKNIKRINKKFKKVKKSDSKIIKEFFDEIRPDKNSIESDGLSISWHIKPKIDFKDLIDGDIPEAFENTKIKVKVNYDIDEDVDVKLEINGKPFKLENPSFGLKLSATTRF